jgi:16S rRNA (adenine1518-N6/adenine1519-N6)-dimethyltransferase
MRKRRLGQNFLYDPSILRRIIQVAHLEPEDTVVEVGPGPGRLTRMLSERVRRVIAIELDRKLHERLIEDLADCDNIDLVLGDALKYNYGGIASPFKVVANIPYQITTPLIFRLFENRETLRSMTLTVQKEVAERIAADPGGKQYGVLSITTQYYGKTRLKFVISRKAFRPMPRVDSACIHIDVYEKPRVEVDDERFFFSLVRTAFSHRRKTLLNALREVSPGIKDILVSCGIDPSRRPETLSIEDFARLSENIRNR